MIFEADFSAPCKRLGNFYQVAVQIKVIIYEIGETKD